MICIINNDKIMSAYMTLSILCGYGINYCYNKVKNKYYNKINKLYSDIENQKESISDEINILDNVPNKLL